MKVIVYALSLLFIQKIYSQTVPNGNFENFADSGRIYFWDGSSNLILTDGTKLPKDWNFTFQGIQNGEDIRKYFQQSELSYTGNYAVKLYAETHKNWSSNAAMFTNIPQGALRPTSINGYIKLFPGSPEGMYLGFNLNGQTFSIQATPEYQKFSIPITIENISTITCHAFKVGYEIISGVYYINNSGYLLLDDLHFGYDEALGLESSDFINKDFYYPNPTNQNILTFNFKGLTKYNEIEILDVQGKVRATLTSEENIAYLDLSAIENGIYMVKISSNEKIHTSKLVVQK